MPRRTTAFAAAAAAAAVPQASSYTIADLGTLGGTRSQSFSVNAAGHVVGFSLLAGGSLGAEHAFLHNGIAMTDLGTLSGSGYSRGMGINDSGQIVGEASAGGTTVRAFIYSGGVMTDLGTLGSTNSYAYGINNGGTVVGTYIVPNTSNRHAFRWTSGGGMQDIGTLGGTQSSALSINTAGDIAGSARITGNKASHAALWPAGGGAAIDLGTLGGTYSYAYGINDSNQVVGYSNIAGNAYDHAFLWTSGGGMQDIGTLGGSESYARDINNAGQVVGWSYTSGVSYSRAFIYDSVNGMRNLNTLIPSGSGWTLIEGYSINDAGQIAGYGLISGQYHAFLLTPVDVGEQPPTANNQSVNVKEGTLKDITLTASDPNNDLLTYNVLTNPTNGMLTGTAPTLTYKPNAGYVGSDSFTFKANDGTADSNTATVSITVNPNQLPTANNQSVTTTQNTAKNITLTASDPDNDRLIYAVVDSPANGSLTGMAPTLTYTPNAGYVGSDRFTFKANDGMADSNTATVSITVNAPSSTVTLSSLTLSPTAVTGGCQNSTGKVTLGAAAPAGGTTVMLSISNAAASVPASVVVAGGQTSATFAITTTTVGVQQRPVITAKLGATQKTATLTVNVITLMSVVLSPTPVKGGQPSTATVKQSCISRNGDTLVTLKSSAPTVAQPAVSQITIPAGVQTGTFTVTTSPQTIKKTATISATANGSTRSVTLTVNP